MHPFEIHNGYGNNGESSGLWGTRKGGSWHARSGSLGLEPRWNFGNGPVWDKPVTQNSVPEYPGYRKFPGNLPGRQVLRTIAWVVLARIQLAVHSPESKYRHRHLLHG